MNDYCVVIVIVVVGVVVVVVVCSWDNSTEGVAASQRVVSTSPVLCAYHGRGGRVVRRGQVFFPGGGTRI